jgi:hypothetical protein
MSNKSVINKNCSEIFKSFNCYVKTGQSDVVCKSVQFEVWIGKGSSTFYAVSEIGKTWLGRRLRDGPGVAFRIFYWVGSGSIKFFVLMSLSENFWDICHRIFD